MKVNDTIFNFIINFMILATTLYLMFMLYSFYHMYEVDQIRNKQQYKYNLSFSPVSNSTYDVNHIADQIGKLDDFNVGNWYFYGYETEIGDSKENFTANVYFNINEPLKYVLESGSYWNDSVEKNAIIIGNGLLNRTFHEGNETYIHMLGEKCRVIGILADETGVNRDTRVLLYYKNLTKSISSRLIQTTSWFLSSDHSDVYDHTEDMCAWLDSVYHGLAQSYDEDIRYSSNIIDYLRKLMMILTLFALYHSFLISKTIFERYKKDLVIMRMCGMSALKILKHFYQKIWYCYAASLLCVLLICKNMFVLVSGIGIILLFILTTLIPILFVLRKRSLRSLYANIFEVI